MNDSGGIVCNKQAQIQKLPVINQIINISICLFCKCVKKAKNDIKIKGVRPLYSLEY